MGKLNNIDVELFCAYVWVIEMSLYMKFLGKIDHIIGSLFVGDWAKVRVCQNGHEENCQKMLALNL
jgi:hypothetical protein